MKKLLFISYLLLLFISNIYNQVTINGRNILVNGNRFVIKGVCYSPVEKGSDRFAGTDLSQIDKDIQLMNDACINTIRLYTAIDDRSFYDKFAAAGIRVIVGFPNYDDTKQYCDISSGSYLTFIEKYKDHPAILFWELGNEYNYHPEWFSNDINNWYTILNDAALSIKEIDNTHPVSSAHGEVPSSDVFAKCPDIDIWGMNIYRWDNPSGASTNFKGKSTKPFYFSEAGADRYNNKTNVEDQPSHAKAMANIVNNTFSVIQDCSGLTIFSFVDEWWKGGNNESHDKTGFVNTIPYDNYANEEWFGIVDIERNTTRGYDTIKHIFCNTSVDVQNLSNELNLKPFIYPNPTEDFLIIKNAEISSYSIFTLDGRMAITQNNLKTRTESKIDIRALIPNLYFIKFVTNSNISVQKFQKVN